jgi:hypothetical protein
MTEEYAVDVSDPGSVVPIAICQLLIAEFPNPTLRKNREEWSTHCLKRDGKGGAPGFH